jgi:hypothetical protein
MRVFYLVLLRNTLLQFCRLQAITTATYSSLIRISFFTQHIWAFCYMWWCKLPLLQCFLTTSWTICINRPYFGPQTFRQWLQFHFIQHRFAAKTSEYHYKCPMRHIKRLVATSFTSHVRTSVTALFILFTLVLTKHSWIRYKTKHREFW